jgi:hypothetical protein
MLRRRAIDVGSVSNRQILLSKIAKSALKRATDASF